jgi:predicted dehydrogenase
MQAPVRIGILGAGPWGLNLFRAFRGTPRANVTVICDTDAERAALLRSGDASITVTTSPEALLDSRSVDAVAIATPAETHAPLALSALSAGHHVFVEKPLALSVPDAALLCARAREVARALMVGHVLLYHPAVTELLARIRSGELGDIVRVHSRRLSASKRRRREGPWWSLAPHDVSLVRRLLGAEPTEVSAAWSPSRHGSERVEATLAYTGSRFATIEVGLAECTDVRLVLVVGTRMSALFDDRAAGSKLVLFETAVDSPCHDDLFAVSRQSSRVIPLATEEPLIIEARRFVELILDGRPAPSDASEGLSVTSILEQGARSLAAKGTPVRVERTGTRAISAS